MINHKELLQKFTRRLGIPESEGRLSLEIFSKLVSENLEFGDEIEIDKLGYFVFNRVRAGDIESDVYQRVLLFSEEKISQQNKNFLLFFLPVKFEREAPHIDSFLNLSFGKPLIISHTTEGSDLVLSASNKEIISLIESKVEKLFSEGMIHKSSNFNEQEFTIPGGEQEILFDTAALQNETVDKADKPEFEPEPVTQINFEEQKDINNFDDYELVEPDKNSSLEESKIEKEQDVKWSMDDLALQDYTELQNEEESAPTFDGYTEVKDLLLEKTLHQDSLTEKDDSEKSSDDRRDLSPKRTTKRKLILLLFVIIIAVLAAGVYLNYDLIKSAIFKNESNITQTVAPQKKIEPNVIARTFETPVTYPYKIEEEVLGQIPDSLIISTSIFTSKQTVATDANTNTELIPTTENDLVKVQQNIYQRGSEFLVQVSSWKSKSKAESELKKFIENGFRAELFEEYSREIGKYRRLMVGGFKSIDEANHFLNQNK